MRIALDANCFIDALNPSSKALTSLQRIIAAFRAGEITLFVSRHTLSELAKKPDAAYELAQEAEVLPYWPIGQIRDQVATIEQLSGTWADAGRNEEIQQELKRLAASGNGIRDRGAFLDALFADVDAFVTSDEHLAGHGASERIGQCFRTRVSKPSELVAEMSRRTESNEASL